MGTLTPRLKCKTHPATMGETKDRRLQPLIILLKNEQEADILDAALARGKALTLDQVVADLLTEFRPSDISMS